MCQALYNQDLVVERGVLTGGDIAVNRIEKKSLISRSLHCMKERDKQVK